MVVVAVILLILVLLAGWILTVLAMPGNWLMVAATATYAYFVTEPSVVAIGWAVVAGMALLAALGELVEFVAGALGVAKTGGSKRGAALALVGSLIGAMAGLFIGLPIPVIGSLVGAVLLAGLGALVGAILGEQWKGRDMEESWKVGMGAFWGRLFGTLAKTIIGSIMLAVALAALCF